MSKKYSTYEMRKLSSRIVILNDKSKQPILRTCLDSAQFYQDEVQKNQRKYREVIAQLKSELNKS